MSGASQSREFSAVLNSYADVSPQLVVEDGLLNDCNERAVSTGVLVPARIWEEVFWLQASWACKPRVRNVSSKVSSALLVTAHALRCIRLRKCVQSLRPKSKFQCITTSTTRTLNCRSTVRCALYWYRQWLRFAVVRWIAQVDSDDYQCIIRNGQAVQISD